MAEFSRPPAGPGSPNSQIAPTIPLHKADPQRQEQYAALAALSDGDVHKLDIDEPQEEQDEVIEKEPVKAMPTEADRKAFLSALMGDKQYEKDFQLFGRISMKLRDRTVDDTEAVLRVLGVKDDSERLTQDDYALTYDRYLLVVQLAQLNGNPYVPLNFEHDVEKNKVMLDEAVKQRLITLKRPVYHAALETLRRFEDENSYMTEHALDSDFWMPGGQALQLQRKPAARSTTAVGAGTMHTGH